MPEDFGDRSPFLEILSACCGPKGNLESDDPPLYCVLDKAVSITFLVFLSWNELLRVEENLNLIAPKAWFIQVIWRSPICHEKWLSFLKIQVKG